MFKLYIFHLNWNVKRTKIKKKGPGLTGKSAQNVSIWEQDGENNLSCVVSWSKIDFFWPKFDFIWHKLTLFGQNWLHLTSTDFIFGKILISFGIKWTYIIGQTWLKCSVGFNVWPNIWLANEINYRMFGLSFYCSPLWLGWRSGDLTCSLADLPGIWPYWLICKSFQSIPTSTFTIKVVALYMFIGTIWTIGL